MSENFSHVMILEGEKGTVTERSKKICTDLLGREYKDKIKKNICSDVVFVGKDDKSIGVSEIRYIQNDAFISPVECKFKIYIFENAERLTEQAQNALLKIFEDPPAKVVFLLLCENYKKFIPTVLSRCRLIITKRTSDTERKINSDCNRFINYLIDNGNILALSICSKYITDREKLKKFINESKNLISKKIINEELDIEQIKYCAKLNQCIEYLNKNMNKQLSLISIFL